MNVDIRPCKKSDLPIINKLLRVPSFKLAYGKYMDKESYKNYLNKDYFLIALIEEKITGAIMGEKLKFDGAVIWYILVDKNLRRIGIGSELLKRFEKNHKKNKGRWIMVYSSPKSKAAKF